MSKKIDFRCPLQRANIKSWGVKAMINNKILGAINEKFKYIKRALLLHN